MTKPERKNKESKERRSSTPRIHTVPTKELYDHKPGMWKVSLYLDKQLVRRLTFLVK